MKLTIRKTTLLLAMLVLAGSSPAAYAQDNESLVRNLVRGKGENYLDDQLFVALTYNVLTGMPEKMKTYSFSNTVSLGYVRDIPLNRRRNIGLGAGVGFSFHSFYTNLAMTKNGEGMAQITLMEGDQYKTNRFSLQTFDIPVQIRFRGSAADKYRFWRVYAGVTSSLVMKNYTTLNDGKLKARYYNAPYLQNWLFTANLQVGYGKFTLKADYTLNPMFKASRVAEIDGLEDTRNLSVGLLVYIL